MSTNKKKNFLSRVNIIDILIILIVLITAISAIWAKDHILGENIGKGEKIQYKLELKYKKKEFVDAISEGGNIRNSIDGKYLGKVIEKEVQTATDITPNIEEGKYIKAEMPDLYDIILTIEANGKVSPQGINVEGEDMKIGKQLFISGKGYASSTFVVGMEFNQ